MAGKFRVLFECTIYHITVRVIERRCLFDDIDRESFFKQGGEAMDTSRVRLYLLALHQIQRLRQRMAKEADLKRCVKRLGSDQCGTNRH